MAGSAAKVTSIDAIRSFRVALIAFQEELSRAVVSLDLECRRPLDWMEHDRARYWPREVRRASDVMNEARLNLERCLLTIDPNDHRSCYDERKQSEAAKRRLTFAETKVQAVQQWRQRLKKEVEEFQVQTAKAKEYLEVDLPRAVAQLSRMLDALDRYVRAMRPASDPVDSHSGGGGSSDSEGANSKTEADHENL
ncbi:MAG: hypothetical protein FJ295_13395 [Planctomycetes bacterium]|nr:hypothetical protein [Planctomycetota bacterium]